MTGGRRCCSSASARWFSSCRRRFWSAARRCRSRRRRFAERCAVTEPACPCREAFRSPQFIVLGLTFFACCAAHSGPIFHMVSYAMICGIAPMAAVSIFSVEGLAGLGGRLLYGVLGRPARREAGARRRPSDPGSSRIAAYSAVSQLGEFYVLAIIFGSTYGGVMPLYAVLAREYFGPRILGTVFGAATMLSSLGMAFGPLIGGWIFDTFGSYSWLFIGSAIVGLGAAAVALAFPPLPAKNHSRPLAWLRSETPFGARTQSQAAVGDDGRLHENRVALLWRCNLALSCIALRRFPLDTSPIRFITYVLGFSGGYRRHGRTCAIARIHQAAGPVRQGRADHRRLDRHRCGTCPRLCRAGGQGRRSTTMPAANRPRSWPTEIRGRRRHGASDPGRRVEGRRDRACRRGDGRRPSASSTG